MSVLELSKRNRTIRKFRQEPIRPSDLEELLETLRFCHCANNLQKLRFLLVESEEMLRRVASLVHYAALLPPEIGTPAKDEEPTAYLVLTVPKNSGWVVDIDAGIAAQVITESACEKGIGSCIIANFKPEEMNEALGVETDRTARLVVSLGYPAIASEAVDAKSGSSRKQLAYHLDENGYHVPKLPVSDLVKRL
jgi:FMN reductase [NAD(P)H]